MHTVSISCNSDIEAIVDDYPCGRTGGERHALSRQSGKGRALEISFTDLHHVDAPADGAGDLIQQQPLEGRPLTSGDR